MYVLKTEKKTTINVIMKILAFDIGIKNLAYCIMNKDTDGKLEIKAIDTVSILSEPIKTCNGVQKSGKICGKKCSTTWILDECSFFSCKTHFPKIIVFDKKKNTYSDKKCNEYSLHELAKNMIIKLNEIFKNEEFVDIDKILIELQPSFAVKMKFLSHILYCKITENFINFHTKINFVKGTEKLKVYKGPPLECKLKTAYSKRKWLSVEYSKILLKELFCNDQYDLWYPCLFNNSKCDDACDSLLYCLYSFNQKKQYNTSKKPKTKFKRIRKNKCVI
jgi:hypothetical protein